MFWATAVFFYFLNGSSRDASMRRKGGSSPVFWERAKRKNTYSYLSMHWHRRNVKNQNLLGWAKLTFGRNHVPVAPTPPLDPPGALDEVAET